MAENNTNNSNNSTNNNGVANKEKRLNNIIEETLNKDNNIQEKKAPEKTSGILNSAGEKNNIIDRLNVENNKKNNGNIKERTAGRLVDVAKKTLNTNKNDKDIETKAFDILDKFTGIGAVKEDKEKEEEIKEINNNDNNDNFKKQEELYLQLLEKTKNKNLLNKKLKEKELTLKERIEYTKNFIKAEEKIDNIENKNLKTFLLNKLEKEADIDNNIISNIDKLKNEYLVAKTVKPKVALGKVIEEKIENDEYLPLETQKELNYVFTAPKDIAGDLGLDLSMLKTNVRLKLEKQLNDNTDIEKIKQKKAIIEEKIRQNLKREKEIDALKGRYKAINSRISQTKDINEKQKLIGEKKELEILLSSTVKDYKDEKTKNLMELEQIKQLEGITKIKEKEKEKSKKILENISNTELNEEEYDISDTVKRIVQKEYNDEKENLEKKYKEKIENDKDLEFKSLKQKVLEEDIDLEQMKKSMEDKIRTKEKKEKELDEELDKKEIELEVKSNLVNAEIDESKAQSSKEYNEAVLKKNAAIVKEGLGKININKERLKAKGEDDFDLEKVREERKVKKDIKTINSSLQTKIDEINKEYSEYKKSGNYDSNVVDDYEYKINAYKQLQNNLKDNKISLKDKKGLISLLGKDEVVRDYISVKNGNDIDVNHFVDDLLNTDIEKSDEGQVSEKFRDYLNSEKYSLIEEFIKLKNEIPKFDNIGIKDDILEKASELKIGDNDEVRKKLGKLIKLQRNILHYDNGESQVKRNIVSKLKGKKEDLEKTLKTLKTDGTDDEKREKILNIIKNIDTEISKIEDIDKAKRKISSSEIKEISKNIELFNVGTKFNDFQDIFTGLKDDVLAGNKLMPDLENSGDADQYTTAKLNELSSKKIDALEKSIKSIPNNSTMVLKKHKNELIKELAKAKDLKEKINKGRILDEGVIDFFRDENLYKLDLEEKIKVALEELNDENTNDLRKEELKKEVNELFVKLEKINKKDIGEALSVEIKESAGKYEIDKDLINKELEDGFKNANTAKGGLFSSYKGKVDNLYENALDRWAEIGHDAKLTYKVVANELKNGKSIFEETPEEIDARNKKVDKYVHAMVLTGLSGLFLFFPKMINKISTTITKFPKFIEFLKEKLAEYKNYIFGTILFTTFIVVAGVPQSEFNFLNINTHLYTVLNYVKEGGNIEFSDTLGEKGPLLYYKLNTYLFFIFLIVLYNVILEFLDKYITVLKEPKMGIDMLMLSILKLAIFFAYLSLLFKANTLIGG